MEKTLAQVWLDKIIQEAKRPKKLVIQTCQAGIDAYQKALKQDTEHYIELSRRKEEYVQRVILNYTKIQMPITPAKIKRHELKIVEINSPEGRKYVYIERAGKILCEDSFNYKLC